LRELGLHDEKTFVGYAPVDLDVLVSDDLPVLSLPFADGVVLGDRIPDLTDQALAGRETVLDPVGLSPCVHTSEQSSDMPP